MVNKMVTVKKFKENGFKFVVDDELALNSNQKAAYNLMPAGLSAIEEGQERYNDDFVINLVWRKNTGVMPVSCDCWVDVEFVSGVSDTDLACAYNWGNELLTKWKPSLKHLEQQMNDNQETKTALEMSERDIENYADDCDVERELKESDEVIWDNGETAYVEHSTHDEIVFIGLSNNKAVAVCECITNERKVILDKFWLSDLLKEKPETPEQKAARERMESAYDLYIISFDRFKKDPIEVWLAIADKTGYRKQ